MLIAMGEVLEAAEALKAVNLTVDLHTEELLKLLVAVDLVPLGGLYDGPLASEAARRYELHWLPLLGGHCEPLPNTQCLIPPLDVAWAWLIHRAHPDAYFKDCTRLFGRPLDPTCKQALAFGDGTGASKTSADAWMKAQCIVSGAQPRMSLMGGRISLSGLTPSSRGGRTSPGPSAPSSAAAAQHTQQVKPERYWPPVLPRALRVAMTGRLGTKQWATPVDVDAAECELRGEEGPTIEAATAEAVHQEKFVSQLSVDLVDAMAAKGQLLRNMLRACYNETAFMSAAHDRYKHFLLLWKENPGVTLVPMYDIDLVWHTHMAHSGQYREDCMAVNDGQVLDRGDVSPADVLPGGLSSIELTKRLYEERYDALYNPPLTQAVPPGERHPAEALLGPWVLSLFDAPGSSSLAVRRAALRVREAWAAVAAASKHKWIVKSDPAVLAARKQLSEVVAAANQVKTGTLAQLKATEVGESSSKEGAAAQHRNGGHALFLLHVMQLNLAKVCEGSSCWGSCIGPSLCEQPQQAEAAQRMVQHALSIVRFDPRAAPFNSAHSLWKRLFTCIEVSPVTVWRTPPGVTPGTLQAALDAAAVAKGVASPQVLRIKSLMSQTSADVAVLGATAHQHLSGASSLPAAATGGMLPAIKGTSSSSKRMRMLKGRGKGQVVPMDPDAQLGDSAHMDELLNRDSLPAVAEDGAAGWSGGSRQAPGSSTSLSENHAGGAGLAVAGAAYLGAAAGPSPPSTAPNVNQSGPAASLQSISEAGSMWGMQDLWAHPSLAQKAHRCNFSPYDLAFLGGGWATQEFLGDLAAWDVGHVIATKSISGSLPHSHHSAHSMKPAGGITFEVLADPVNAANVLAEVNHALSQIIGVSVCDMRLSASGASHTTSKGGAGGAKASFGRKTGASVVGALDVLIITRTEFSAAQPQADSAGYGCELVVAAECGAVAHRPSHT